MYSDEYIDHWGEIFVANQLHLYGLTFFAFLHSPQAYLEYCGMAPLPLLPSQRTVQARVDAMAAEEHHETELGNRVRMTDGRLVEPLKHHAWNH